MAQIFYSCALERINDQTAYEHIKNQIDTLPAPVFGRDIHVLVITDRLPECAKGLVEYLKQSSDITANLVHDLNDAEQIIRQKPADFLVIVGYLRTKANYKAASLVTEHRPHADVIMYAYPDGLIEKECSKYRIQYVYDRFAPVDGFVSFLRGICRTYEVAK